VTEVDYTEQLKALDAILRNVEVVVDLPRLHKDKAELESAAAEPSLWDDPGRAQQVTSKLSYVTAEISKVPGVTGVQVDVAAGRVTVQSDQPVSADAIADAVEEAGYEVLAA